jgi:hypothetical protein
MSLSAAYIFSILCFVGTFAQAAPTKITSETSSNLNAERSIPESAQYPLAIIGLIHLSAEALVLAASLVGMLVLGCMLACLGVAGMAEWWREKGGEKRGNNRPGNEDVELGAV